MVLSWILINKINLKKNLTKHNNDFIHRREIVLGLFVLARRMAILQHVTIIVLIRRQSKILLEREELGMCALHLLQHLASIRRVRVDTHREPERLAHTLRVREAQKRVCARSDSEPAAHSGRPVLLNEIDVLVHTVELVQGGLVGRVVQALIGGVRWNGRSGQGRRRHAHHVLLDLVGEELRKGEHHGQRDARPDGPVDLRARAKNDALVLVEKLLLLLTFEFESLTTSCLLVKEQL